VYVIRRVYQVEPRQARRAATLVAAIGRSYQEEGQRGEVQVYFNGSTLPGERDVVYMQWTAETIESPYRAGNVFPTGTDEWAAQLREIQIDSWIEFYELLTPDKEVPLDG
jgi:hypothetical protein